MSKKIVKYEDEDSISIWTYDFDKFKNGPISVERIEKKPEPVKKKKKMKVIFLDHDGVICLSNNWGSRFKKQAKTRTKLTQSVRGLPIDSRFDNFDKKSIKILNKILEETDAEIVISSDWRNWCSVEEMGEYYKNQGITKKPIEFTKFIQDCEYEKEFPWLRQWDLEQTRSIEIKQYLKEHPEVSHWVGIDDLDMGKNEEWKTWGLDNFVLTPLSDEGIKQLGIKKKVVSFLK